MQKTQDRTKIWIQGEPSLYQLRDRTHFPGWGSLTVWDAVFNNSAAGLMIVSAIVFACGSGFLGRILPVSLTLALILVLTDLLLLVADLGDPWRFYHSLRVMRLTSPLSVGVWGLVCFSIFLFAAVCFSWLIFFIGGDVFAGFILVSARNLFIAMALIGAVVVICYKGVAFSCTSQPGLSRARWLTPFMVSDSLLLGYALFSLVALLFIPPRDSLILSTPMLVLICARCICFGLLWQDVKHRAREIYQAENRLVGWCVFGFCGALPFLLCFLGFFGLVLASLLALVGGIIERYWLIGLPRPLPAPK